MTDTPLAMGLDFDTDSVRALVVEAAAGKRLAAVCVDTTGSSPCPVDREGRPLALSADFAEDPSCMFYLWKDHTARREAAEFNALAGSWQGEDYLRFQGIYSLYLRAGNFMDGLARDN